MRRGKRKNKSYPKEEPWSGEWARKGVKPYIASNMYSLEDDNVDNECMVYVFYILVPSSY